MTYSEITFKDKSSIKRWLQRRRLAVSIRMASHLDPLCIVDFGAGNGELCKLIASRFPRAKIICYEPAPDLMEEAKGNLAGLHQVRFCTDLADVATSSVDLIFCLEVFEHLPPAQTEEAFQQFTRLLNPGGSIVVGVPAEIGLPALYKGIFRISRRFGDYDASIGNVMRATFCAPPKDRPVSEIAPGLAFYFHHLGFDYRSLRSLLHSRFQPRKTTTSPFPLFGPWLNPEVNFLVRKAQSATSP